MRRASGPLLAHDLAERVYASQADGGPEYAAKVIHVMIHKMRPRLAWHGIRILTLGAGAASLGYMIEPEDLPRADGLLDAKTHLSGAIDRAHHLASAKR